MSAGDWAYRIGTGLGVTMFLGTAILGGYSWWPEGLNKEATYKAGIVAGFLLLVGMWGGKVTWNAIRFQTNRIMTQNSLFLFNPNDGVFPAGAFLVRRLGGVNVPKFFMAWPGRDGALIYPEDAEVKLSSNVLLQGVTKRIAFRKLPPGVKDTIEAERISGPYFILYSARHIETRGKDHTAAVREFESQNAARYDENRAMRNALTTAVTASTISRRQVERQTQPKAMTWIQGLYRNEKVNHGDDDDNRRPEA